MAERDNATEEKKQIVHALLRFCRSWIAMFRVSSCSLLQSSGYVLYAVTLGPLRQMTLFHVMAQTMTR